MNRCEKRFGRFFKVEICPATIKPSFFIYSPVSDPSHNPYSSVATVKPFRGLRPQPQFAARVASRPYDVLTSQEARTEVTGNPLSFLRVGKPEVDLPVSVDLYDDAVYAQGRENLTMFVGEGILQQDTVPSLYVYAQTMKGRTQYGIVGCVAVDEYNGNIIRKHELTRKDKEDDRTRHVLSTNAQTGPIFLTYRARPELDALVQSVCAGGPVYDFDADDGVHHAVWTIQDAGICSRIAGLFREIPALYVADGHHRSAAAARAAAQRRMANPHHTGTEEYNYFLAVIFPHNQLHILDYNRTVRDLNGMRPDEFMERVRENFDILESISEVAPERKGSFGLYIKGNWYTLNAKKHLRTPTDPVDGLDVSILQNHILKPLLGIEDPRTDKRIDFVGGIRGLAELRRRVDSGMMAVAFSLHPTSIEELLAIADAGKIMPPKSTWFEPKLRDGLLIHLLD